MKKIGSGWTYNVYEYGQYKVLKKVRPLFQRVFRIIISDPRLIFSLTKTIKNLNSLRINAFAITKKLEETDFNFSSLGNPEIIDSSTYIQTRYASVEMFLSNDKIMKELIEKYISQIKYFWSYGFADIVFNFTINNGLDSNKNITLFDFNEITDNSDLIIKTIKNKTWLRKHSFLFHLNKKQKKYFEERMREEITVENFYKFWEKRILKS